MKKFLVLFWRMSREDLRLLWFALRHRQRPAWLIPATAVLGVYALSPFNFVLPVLGVVDDMVLVPLALHFMLRLLPSTLAAEAGPLRRR